MSAIATIPNETFVNLLKDLLLEDYIPSSNAQALIQAEARYIKDLKINVGNAINNTQQLNRKEALLLALAVSVNERFEPLKESFTRLAQQEGATEAEIAEVIALQK